MAVYDISANRVDYDVLNYDVTVHSTNHRGYNTVAPENTLPAYILSKKMGFTYVECDVSFTSDGVAVLLHDNTIDRTSNGTGNINNLTFAQVRQYDFGSWKSAAYTGTQIPSLEEFLLLCKRIMLHPYIELKDSATYTEAQIQGIVDMVRDCGMRGKVTYISFSATYLGYVKDYDDEARLGYVANANTSHLSTVQALQTGKNDVFYNVNYTTVTSAIREVYAAAGIPMEVWTVNSESAILDMDPYISGIASDSLMAGKVLFEAEMN